jgi:hypothetical protein
MLSDNDKLGNQRVLGLFFDEFKFFLEDYRSKSYSNLNSFFKDYLNNQNRIAKETEYFLINLEELEKEYKYQTST